MNIFQDTKAIPFPEIIKQFCSADIPTSKKIPCPLHQDTAPSLHVYDDGFKCYGCGEAGDGINFVGKLYNINPLDAARLIAKNFNIPTKEMHEMTDTERREVAQARQLWETEKRLATAFREWERNAMDRLSALIESVKLLLSRDGVDIDYKIAELVHRIPLWEHWRGILEGGSIEEKEELYHDADLKRWCFPCQEKSLRNF